MDWLKALIADLSFNWKPKVKRFRLHAVAFGLFALGALQAVDPYALQEFLPGRWGSVVPFVFSVAVWLLRKATSHPVSVTTTFAGEESPKPSSGD